MPKAFPINAAAVSDISIMHREITAIFFEKNRVQISAEDKTYTLPVKVRCCVSSSFFLKVGEKILNITFAQRHPEKLPYSSIMLPISKIASMPADIVFGAK